MKLKKTITLSMAALFALGLMSFDILYSTGEADYTGSPIDGADCTSCHADFALNTGGGSVTIASSPSLASGYTAGADYTISVTVTKSGQSAFGFGFEALKSGNTDGGILSAINAGSKSLVVAGPTNMVHDGSGIGSGTFTFTFNWKAPATSTGTVTFYAAGNATDDDGTASGDYVYTSSLVVNEAAAAAGITITAADYTNLPASNFQNIDTLPVVAITPGAAGANVTWDFTALNANLNVANELITPSTGLLGSSFPTANMCLNQGNTDYLYFDQQLSGIDLLGYAGDLLQNGAPFEAVVLSNPETVITFPSTYTTSFNDVSAYDASYAYNGTYSGIQVDSVREKETITITSLIDGYGTVITPTYATGYPCIRQNVTKVSVDSTWAKIVNPLSGLHYWISTSGTTSTYRSFTYITNVIGGPIVDIQMKADAAGNANTDISEVKWNPATPVGIAKYSNSDIRVYPNPASEYLIINKTSKENLNVVMYDVMGREVLNSAINGQSTKISVASLANGTYILKMFNKGAIVQTNNIIINN
ncbi:MAG: hypothetical protein A3F72_18365 [Bacteroidetes bacterium RIFCSPLOWO2_12_FULL_35_15]|nr:MAG: hypothetical protein A3F72_18365 [Bacteroidetes bacterium RIFCSPLOWO2_12_FULL_35_15]